MAARKRSPRRFTSSHVLPLLEILEDRIAFSVGQSALAPANLLDLYHSNASLALTPNKDLIPIPLVNGGTAWMQGPSALGLKLPAGSTPTGNSHPPLNQSLPNASGVILGKLPVASPIDLAAPQQSTGPAGYIPQQLQTAYGLSTGTALNNNITFAGITESSIGKDTFMLPLVSPLP